MRLENEVRAYSNGMNHVYLRPRPHFPIYVPNPHPSPFPSPTPTQTQHVITVPQQAWLGALGTGPNGHALSSAFGRRDDQEYQQELGETLIRLARIVPAGMLVFFPSYGA